MLLLQPPAVTTSKMDCIFVSTKNSNTELYACLAEDNGIFRGSRANIDSAEGVHQHGKRNADVNGVYFILIENLRFFPSNMNKVFGNLLMINVQMSRLSEITEIDLKPFTKLRFLFLVLNHIKFLANGLFQHNKDLREVQLSGNQISKIEPLVFDGLNSLHVLELVKNKCRKPFGAAETRAEVLEFIRRIKAGECYSATLYEKIVMIRGRKSTFLSIISVGA